MINKALLGGVVGFILGGLVVSTVAVTLDKNETKDNTAQTSTTDHNQATTDKLRGLKGDDFDKAFIEEMIGHHQGAIDMAKLIESNAKHAELKELGQDIISAQSNEINTMQTWQENWGYKVNSQSHEMHGM